MFISERTLLVSVTLDASGIRAGGQSGLFQLKTAVRIVTIAAIHGAFENFVMERHTERRLHLAVATQTKLGLTLLQHRDGREARLFGIRGSHEYIRTSPVLARNV